MKRIYANWRLKCIENRQLKLTIVGETGPKLICTNVKLCSSWLSLSSRGSRWTEPYSVLQVCTSGRCIVGHVLIMVSHGWWTTLWSQACWPHVPMMPFITTFCQEQNCCMPIRYRSESNIEIKIFSPYYLVSTKDIANDVNTSFCGI